MATKKKRAVRRKKSPAKRAARRLSGVVQKTLARVFGCPPGLHDAVIVKDDYPELVMRCKRCKRTLRSVD